MIQSRDMVVSDLTMPRAIKGDCLVCTSQKAKYRCPLCNIEYCTLACFKQHKNSELCKKKPIPMKENIEVEKFTLPAPAVNLKLQISEEDLEQDYIPTDKLKELCASNQLKTLLNNDHLRNMLTEIDTSDNAASMMEKAMQVPIFTEFVDECLRIVEPSSKEADEM